MTPEVESRAAELRQARVPFVHARVVRAERPTSAKPGDQAVVLPDGSPGTITASSTDILGEVVPEDASTVLSLEGIRRLRELVGTLKPARGSTSGAKTRK